MPRTAVLLTITLALAGCGGATGSPAVTPDVAGEWELADGSAGGAPLPQPPGSAATLEIDGQELRGVAFCNSYFSAYRMDGPAFSVDQLGQTEMACEPDVMAAEGAYLGALGGVDTAAADGRDLLLTGDGIELRFTPVAPVPDAPLEGTRWVLETVVDGETASSTVGEPPTLLLDGDRRATATTGCASITGTWLVEDGALVIDDLLVLSECTAGEPSSQHGHVAAVLQGGPVLEIEEDRLTLTADDGTGLVYRVEG